jgi:uncharacterized protein (TIGR00369 family)
MANGPTRMEVITGFIPTSPLPAALGIRLESIEPDRARLALPWSEPLATMADVVHGGAIATLADTAAMAAAWASDDVPESLTGATVSLTLDYLAAARGNLVADAHVLRRGTRLVYVRVDVADGEGTVVAAGQAVYSLGG